MRVIVGLGNPGSHYAATRHNLGFAVVEELARRWRLLLGSPRCGSCLAQGVHDHEQVLLVQPQLYMNRSGSALSQLPVLLSAADLVVVHDDLDLDCGHLRIKRGGGSGGHRGVESIAECYGPDFLRVRIGVGRPSTGEDVADYVLSPFAAAGRAAADTAVCRAADAVECIVRHGLEVAMNRFNTRSANGPLGTAAQTGRN